MYGVEGLLEVNEGDNGWKMVCLHTLNDSSQGEDLCYRSSIRTETVLINPELQIDDAAYAVENQPVVDLGYYADQADASVVVCIGQVTRLGHRNYIHKLAFVTNCPGCHTMPRLSERGY